MPPFLLPFCPYGRGMHLKFASILLAAISVPAIASDLPLERVFASPSLSGPTPRQAKLSPDGRLVTLLKNRPDDKDRYDLWAIDTATGAERMLVDSQKIGTGAAISEEEKMRRERARIAGTKGITAYGWAPDSRSILVPIDGDLYVATLDGNVRRLTSTAATEIDPKVSETGRFLSFLRDQNLYVMRAADKASLRHRAAVHRFLNSWLKADRPQLGNEAGTNRVVTRRVDRMRPLIAEDALEPAERPVRIEITRLDGLWGARRNDHQPLRGESGKEQRHNQQPPPASCHPPLP